MNPILTESIALRALLIILSLLVLFHLLVLIKMIPFELVWGSKLSGESQMYAFEAVSILISLLMLIVVSVRAQIIKVPVNNRIVTIILWIMCCFFCLNTVSNLLADHPFEKLVFAPLTFFLALLTFRVARAKEQTTIVDDAINHD